MGGNNTGLCFTLYKHKIRIGYYPHTCRVHVSSAQAESLMPAPKVADSGTTSLYKDYIRKGTDIMPTNIELKFADFSILLSRYMQPFSHGLSQARRNLLLLPLLAYGCNRLNVLCTDYLIVIAKPFLFSQPLLLLSYLGPI